MDPQEPQNKTLPGTEMAYPRETKPGNTEATSLVIPCETSQVTQRATKPGTPMATTPGTTNTFSTPRNMNFFSPGIDIGYPKSSMLVSSNIVTHYRLPFLENKHEDAKNIKFT